MRWRIGCMGTLAMTLPAKAEPKLVTIGRLASAARAGLIGVRALVSAQLVRPARQNAQGVRLFHERDHVRARLLLDLLDAGVTLHELRQMDATTSVDREAASQLLGLMDRVINRVTAQLERLRQIREDLVRSRETLYRCLNCDQRGPGCRGCGVMPNPPPEALDVFFLPQP
jgi:DNA-binding transcriptional MerR regulator